MGAAPRERPSLKYERVYARIDYARIQEWPTPVCPLPSLPPYTGEGIGEEKEDAVAQNSQR